MLPLFFCFFAYRPTEAQSFNLSTFPVGFKPGGIKIFNLNQDNIPDIAVLSTANDTLLALFYGTGDGTFQAPELQRKVHNYGLFDISDIDGDDYPDLLLGGYWHNGFRILTGNVANKFTFLADYDMGGHATDVLYTDIDNDGKQDVIGVTSGSANPVTLHIYIGDNTGKLRKTGSFPTMLSGNQEIFVTDKNGDRLKDIIVSTRNWLAIFYQQSDGSFKLRYWPVYGAAPVVADINMDKSPDLILGFPDFEMPGSQDSILVNFGEADTMFNLKPLKIAIPGLRPGALTIADLDKDSYPDLIVSHYNLSGEKTDSLFLLKGMGNAGFSFAKIIRLPGAVNHIAVCDLDRDSYPEIVAAATNNLVVIHNNGSLLSGKPPLWNDRVKIFPNPANDKIYVNLPEVCNELQVTDVFGNIKLIKRDFESSQIDMGTFTPGIYIFQGYTNKKLTFTKKVIKQ